MAEKDGKLVVYEALTGTAYLLDEGTGKIERALEKPAEDRNLLKDEDGHYRKEVKSYCKQLYFDGLTAREISDKTGVKVNTVSNWIYGRSHNGDTWTCWQAQKRRAVDESRQQNIEKYVKVERTALHKIHEYLLNPKTHIENPRQFKEFAEAISKLLYVSGNPKAEVADKSQKTQININTNVVPLSPEEARNILERDPIRLVKKGDEEEEAEIKE